MDRTQVGRAAMIVGLLIMFVGIIAVATGGGDDGGALQPAVSTTTTTTTTTVAPASTSTSPPTTAVATTAAPATTTAPTTSTTLAPTTTSTTIPPTTTAEPSAAVGAFIAQFAADIADADTPALMATLNPAVVLGSGEQLCRDFVDREILAISNYQLVGMIDGPVSKSIDTVAGKVTVDGIYVADVSFDFGGQTFPSQADFVVDEDGVVSWLATCR